MDWSEALLGGLNVLILAVTGLLARSLRRLRDNDLEHIQQSLNRIERRLDEHIQHHLTRGL